MTKVFVSRNLSNDSPIRRVCDEKRLSLTDESLLKFEAIPFDNIPDIDWIFFYSKNGVKFFFEQSKKDLASSVKIGVMGAPTGRSIAAFRDLKLDFVGKGGIDHIASTFQRKVEGKSVLFVKAKFSRSSIETRLTNVDIHPLVVYDNSVRVDLPNFSSPDILIFTSPMNAEAYVDQFGIPTSTKVLAIGPTTSLALKKIGVESALIAEQPSEESLAKLLEKTLHV